MKTFFKSFVFAALVLGGFSCTDDEPTKAQPGRISFTFDQKANNGGRTASTPDALIVSVEDSDGKSIYENKRLQLTAFGQGYITESIEIETGNYNVTKFIIIDETNKAKYATPFEGSAKAPLVSDALPVAFNVASEKTSNLVLQVLEVADDDTPDAFGYVTFGFEVVGSTTMDIRVKLELTIRGLLYQNLDAEFTVTAYDKNNQEKWKKSFPYTGPQTNALTVKANYDHYAFEVRKWGAYQKQVINGEHLWEGRVRPGEVPVTYVFGTSLAAKKIASTISYRTNNSVSQPETKTEYSYNANGRLDKITAYLFNVETKQFALSSRQEFSYTDNRVQRIATYRPETEGLYSEDLYTYQADGKVSKIVNKPTVGTSTEVTLTYPNGGREVSAVYRLSNGRGFEYSFVYSSYALNPQSTRTTQDNELCNTGTFTYDKGINPLAHLGYVDYLFRVNSINNRLTENVNYVGCAFPSLVPESYDYTYDEDGYPKTAVTNYKSTSGKLRVEYFYQ